MLRKTALLFWKGRWYKSLATTATTHILKPQIGRLPNGIDLSFSVENEFFCLKLTAALGLPSADVAIREFSRASSQARSPASAYGRRPPTLRAAAPGRTEALRSLYHALHADLEGCRNRAARLTRRYRTDNAPLKSSE